MTPSSEQPPAPPSTSTEQPLDKQVVRLPDGRELTYYRFPEPPPAAPPRPPAGKER